MTQRFKSPVQTVEVDEGKGGVKAYTFALTLDAVGKLQEIWGIDGFNELEKRLANPTVTTVKDIIYACMWATNQETTTDDAKAFCNKIGIQDVMSLVNSIVEAGTPSPAEVGDTRPPRKGRK